MRAAVLAGDRPRDTSPGGLGRRGFLATVLGTAGLLVAVAVGETIAPFAQAGGVGATQSFSRSSTRSGQPDRPPGRCRRYGRRGGLPTDRDRPLPPAPEPLRRRPAGTPPTDFRTPDHLRRGLERGRGVARRPAQIAARTGRSASGARRCGSNRWRTITASTPPRWWTANMPMTPTPCWPSS